MNKIIRNVPVERLPKEWQEGLPPHGLVEIEVRLKSPMGERVKLADLAGTGPNVHGNDQEVIDYIRNLRGSD